jgi:hypothetical protein
MNLELERPNWSCTVKNASLSLGRANSRLTSGRAPTSSGADLIYVDNCFTGAKRNIVGLATIRHAELTKDATSMTAAKDLAKRASTEWVT